MKHVTRIDIRFADIDAMGHVNNAIYLNYFEQARMSFFNDKIGSSWDWKTDGIVLARNEVDYIQPILLNDSVEVETYIENIGKKSLKISYKVFKNQSNQDLLCATGSSVIVCFNYNLGKTTEVPEKWRTLFDVQSSQNI